jgi:S-adenosylhomocysteine hydrolase
MPKSEANRHAQSLGIKIDRLTPEQEEYLAGWSEGT